MKKGTIILLLILIIIVSLWIYVNPAHRFGEITIFGLTTYSCIPYPMTDMQINSSGKIKLISKTHTPSLENFVRLADDKCDILIIATGWNGVLTPPVDINKIKNCEIKILTNKDAITYYNTLKKQNKRVTIYYHSTC